MASFLLVSADQPLAEALRDLFETMDHQVDLAANGAAANSMLSVCSYDLILFDWQLPDVTAVELCRDYRDSGGKAIVLILTGVRDEAAKFSSQEAGADRLLCKPFSVDVLAAIVQTLLSGGGKQ